MRISIRTHLLRSQRVTNEDSKAAGTKAQSIAAMEAKPLESADIATMVGYVLKCVSVSTAALACTITDQLGVELIMSTWLGEETACRALSRVQDLDAYA